MDMGLTDQVVVVTGGASNIGRAISIAFATEGASVVIFDRDEAMAQRTVADIEASGGRAVSYPVDLTDVNAPKLPTSRRRWYIWRCPSPHVERPGAERVRRIRHAPLGRSGFGLGASSCPS